MSPTFMRRLLMLSSVRIEHIRVPSFNSTVTSAMVCPFKISEIAPVNLFLTPMDAAKSSLPIITQGALTMAVAYDPRPRSMFFKLPFVITVTTTNPPSVVNSTSDWISPFFIDVTFPKNVFLALVFLDVSFVIWCSTICFISVEEKSRKLATRFDVEMPSML